MESLHVLFYSFLRKSIINLNSYLGGGFYLSSLRELFTGNSYYKAQTYYPEVCETNGRKSSFQIWSEQMRNLLCHGSFDPYYFLYGFDVKNFRKQKDYVFYPTFYHRRNYTVAINEQSYKDTAILRNKLLFYCFCSAFSFQSPRVIGMIHNGTLNKLHETSDSDIVNFLLQTPGEYFAKSIDGQCGESIYSIASKNNHLIVNEKELSIDEFRRLFANESFILQEKITNQHPLISSLHPHAINTIRLVTIKTKDNKHVFIPPLLRVGTGTSNVDNWAKGGLAIGIDTETNTLKEYGFRKPKFGGKVNTHPDTGIKLLGYPIPFMQEAISMATKLHEKLPNLLSIGWDIAITTDGPVFIEGNDNWEISLMEACSHGLRKEFKELFY